MKKQKQLNLEEEFNQIAKETYPKIIELIEKRDKVISDAFQEYNNLNKELEKLSDESGLPFEDRMYGLNVDYFSDYIYVPKNCKKFFPLGMNVISDVASQFSMNLERMQYSDPEYYDFRYGGEWIGSGC